MATRRQREKQQERRSVAKRRAQQHTSDFERTALAVPDDAVLWKPKADETYMMDIVPYTVSDREFNSECTFADPGELNYERTYFAHYGIGPSDSTYVCPAKTFGLPCPVCEYRSELVRRGASFKDEAVKALNPKERQLFNVFIHSEEKKGVQLWEFSFHNFGKLLDKRINSSASDRYSGFYWPDETGLTLEVTFEDKSGGDFSFVNTLSIDFNRREAPLPKKIVNGVICLDDLPIQIDYDELEKIFLQKGGVSTQRNGRKPTRVEDDDGRAGSSKKTTKSSKVGEEEEEFEEEEEEFEEEDLTAEEAGIEEGSTVLHDDHGECEVLKIAGKGKDKGKLLLLKNKKGKRIINIPVADVDLVEEEEEPEGEDEELDWDDDETPEGGDEELDWDDDETPEGEDEEPEDEELDWDDDETPEDEEEKPAKKPAGKKPRPKAGKSGK